jgi:hypothetical protein
MLSSQHWHSKDLMSGRKDLKYVKHNNCTVARDICQNFNNAASDDLTITILKSVRSATLSNRCCLFELALSGDLVKIHDPTKHLSSDCATANRHCVHCESAFCEAKLRALVAFVWDQAVYVRFSTLFIGPHLRGSSLNEPRP